MYLPWSGNSSYDDSLVSVDYRADDSEGEGSMSAVLETSNRHVDIVSVLVDPFRTTFMFRINSSGKFYRLRMITGKTIWRGEKLVCGMLEGCGVGMGIVSVIVDPF